MIAGNFNLTNVDELNRSLVDRGQHPVFDTDTQAILEETGYYLDAANDKLTLEAETAGVFGSELSRWIGERLEIPAILSKAAFNWDGGYVIAGIVGNGDSFVMRDPLGIRPGYFIQDDELVAFASERAPLMTVFGKEADEVREIEPGTVVVVRSRVSIFPEAMIPIFMPSGRISEGCWLRRFSIQWGVISLIVCSVTSQTRLRALIMVSWTNCVAYAESKCGKAWRRRPSRVKSPPISSTNW